MSPFWDATGPILTATSDFWLYWVVTVPLTVIVLQSWRLWKSRDEARKKQAAEDVEKNFRGTTDGTAKPRVEVRFKTLDTHEGMALRTDHFYYDT